MTTSLLSHGIFWVATAACAVVPLATSVADTTNASKPETVSPNPGDNAGDPLVVGVAFEPVPLAEEAAPPPWAQAVSDEQQARAIWYFHQGLARHKQLLFAQAVTSYERGLAHWAHPKLHLYRGLALAKLGKHLAAYKAFAQVLHSDPRALRADEFALARRTATDLRERELAELTVRCDESGAQVRMNGQPWFTGPGTRRRVVAPGSYSIEVTKRDYLPVARVILVQRGADSVVEPRLVYNRDADVGQRRGLRAVPWLFAGASLAVSAAGAGLFVLSSQVSDQAEQRIGKDCPDGNYLCRSPNGSILLQRAQQQRNASIGLLAAGTGVLATSLAWHYLNRTQRASNQRAKRSFIAVQPLIEPNTQGILLHVDL